MLPTFLVIGAMKSGTSSLHEHLATHPQIFMAEPKELHFFSVDVNFGRGRAWYEQRFDRAGDAAARGESSPSYSQADIFPRTAAASPPWCQTSESCIWCVTRSSGYVRCISTCSPVAASIDRSSMPSSPAPSISTPAGTHGSSITTSSTSRRSRQGVDDRCAARRRSDDVGPVVRIHRGRPSRRSHRRCPAGTVRGQAGRDRAAVKRDTSAAGTRR